jgi:hypothetical protein
MRRGEGRLPGAGVRELGKERGDGGCIRGGGDGLLPGGGGPQLVQQSLDGGGVLGVGAYVHVDQA